MSGDLPYRTPGLRASALRIFDLSLGQMLWSRRSIFLALVIASPVGLAALIRTIVVVAPGSIRAPMTNFDRLGGPLIFGAMIWMLYIRFIVPVLGVFYGTAMIADEVDDKTITYLFTRPIPRAAILVGKYFAFLVCTILLVLPSVVIVYFLVVPIGRGAIGAEFTSLLIDLAIMAIGLAAYGALFGFIGARVKRPLLVGLAFAFGWEPAAMLVPGYLKRLTVGYYLQALVPHSMPQDSGVRSLMQLFNEPPSVRVSLVALAVIVGLSLWLGARTVERREYVLEQ